MYVCHGMVIFWGKQEKVIIFTVYVKVNSWVGVGARRTGCSRRSGDINKELK